MCLINVLLFCHLHISIPKRFIGDNRAADLNLFMTRVFLECITEILPLFMLLSDNFAIFDSRSIGTILQSE